MLSKMGEIDMEVLVSALHLHNLSIFIDEESLQGIFTLELPQKDKSQFSTINRIWKQGHWFSG